MEHLSLEEIIAYAALDGKDDESIALARKVYNHLAECAACREAVGGMLDLSAVMKKRSKNHEKKKQAAEKKQASDI